MPAYTYRCSGCGKERVEVMTFAEHDDAKSHPLYHAVPVAATPNDRDDGGDQGLIECGVYRQVINFQFARSTPEHFNHSIGQYVTNNAAITSSLSRQSDEMSERMGFTVKYETVDPRDPSAVGVTDQGLEATERRHHDDNPDQRTKKLIV